MQNYQIEWPFESGKSSLVGWVLGNAPLTYDELLTVLMQVEATLNSRPLTYNDDNPKMY